jgi:tetratricopeptide (TPR) repeat protein
MLSIFSTVILIAIPEIILHLLSTFPYQFLLGWQYSAPILPFVIISSIFGSSFLLKSLKITYISLFIYILTASFLSNYYFGIKLLTPITDRCYNPTSYNPSNHRTILSISKEKLKEYQKIEKKIRLFETLKKIVLKERIISVLDNMLAHFSQRETFFYSFPSYEKANYVIINTYGVDEGWVQVWGRGEEIKKGIDRLLKDQRFQAFFTDEPGGGKIILFAKKEYKEEIIKNALGIAKANPFLPEAHFILGSVYFYTDNLKMAKKEIEAVLRFEPNNVSAKNMLEAIEQKISLDKN